MHLSPSIDDFSLGTAHDGASRERGGKSVLGAPGRARAAPSWGESLVAVDSPHFRSIPRFFTPLLTSPPPKSSAEEALDTPTTPAAPIDPNSPPDTPTSHTRGRDAAGATWRSTFHPGDPRVPDKGARRGADYYDGGEKTVWDEVMKAERVAAAVRVAAEHEALTPAELKKALGGRVTEDEAMLVDAASYGSPKGKVSTRAFAELLKNA